jgi:TRAP-type C4-dicarboxylate transport system permease small subunit
VHPHTPLPGRGNPSVAGPARFTPSQFQSFNQTGFTTVFSTLRTVFDRVLTTIVVTLLGTLAVIVLMGVFYRKMGWPLVWYDEGASILLAWLTYYGAALAALKRAHIGFPGLVNSFSPAVRVPIVLLAEAIIISFFVVMAYYGYQVLVILEGDTMVSLPSVSVQITQSVIPIGCVLFVIAQLLSLPDVLKQARGKGIIDAEERELEEALKK